MYRKLLGHMGGWEGAWLGEWVGGGATAYSLPCKGCYFLLGANVFGLLLTQVRWRMDQTGCPEKSVLILTMAMVK